MGEDFAATTFCATGAAFAELHDAVLGLASEAEWTKIMASLPADVRAACESGDPKVFFPEPHYVRVLHEADAHTGRDGSIARAIGTTRADAVLATDRTVFEGDPLRFLKIGASLFYRDRANYGAAGLELTEKKAILRFLFSPHLTLKVGDLPNVAPQIVLTFLERTVSELAGAAQVPRYMGHAKRADTRFGQEVFNQHYEFDLDEDKPRE